MKKIIVALFLVPCTLFGAPNLAQIKSQIKATEQQNKQIEEKIKTVEKEVERTKKKLVGAAEKVSGIEAERGVMMKKISELDEKKTKLETEISKNKEQISDALGGILFGAQNPGFDSQNMQEYIIAASAMSGATELLQEEINQAAIKIKELEEVIHEREIEKEKLDRTAKKYGAEKSELDKLLKQRSGQNDALRGQQADIQKKLRELSARAKSISELSSGVGSTEMSGDAKFSTRKLKSPIRGRLTVRYGEKSGLGLESDGWRIRASSEALVTAPADGTVKFADSFKGFGRVLIMSHKNGYNTVLGNLGQLDVLVGQEVLAGEPVARLDSKKTELYLEVRRGKNAVDPARLFNEP